MLKPKMFVCNKLKWKRYGTNIYMISNSLPECLSSQLPIWRSAQQQNQPCKEQNQSPSFYSLLWVVLFFGGVGGADLQLMYIQKNTCFSSPCMVGLYTVFGCLHLVCESNHNQVIAWLWLCLCAEFWQWFHCMYFSYHWCKICNFVHQLTQITQSAWPLIQWNQETTAG